MKYIRGVGKQILLVLAKHGRAEIGFCEASIEHRAGLCYLHAFFFFIKFSKIIRGTQIIIVALDGEAR